MSIEAYLRAVPKAELHVHLEGSILPDTLLTLAQRNGVALPASTVDGLREWFRFRDFPHFVEIYVAITRCLRTTDDYDLIAYEFGAEMARQNVRYAEATFTPATHNALGVPFDTFFTGLTRGRERAQAEFGVQIAWIFDIVRDIEDPAHAEYTLWAAIEGMPAGVVALGLGGHEAPNPPDRFAPWFERARAAGLHTIPHAGETGGPESVWSAINMLGAERLGHGVRSIEDPELVAYLVETGIPIEVCPTSNLRLGLYGSIDTHPMRRLYDAGVVVTINSDDPPLFNTTLNDEVVLLHTGFGFDLDTIDNILLNGVRYSCLPADRKEALMSQFRDEMAILRG